MATETPMATEPGQDLTVEEKVNKLRELFADAPEVGKTALENVLQRLATDASKTPPPVESAGRVGSRLGKVSELTIIVPFAPGGAERLRAFLRLFGGGRPGCPHGPHRLVARPKSMFAWLVKDERDGAD